jgi:hypothetical protein
LVGRGNIVGQVMTREEKMNFQLRHAQVIACFCFSLYVKHALLYYRVIPCSFNQWIHALFLWF